MSVFDALGGAEAAHAGAYQELVVGFVRHGKKGGVEGAQKMLKRMQKDGCPPDALTYGRVVHHLTKNAQTSLALAFLEPLEKLQPYDASIVEVSYSKLIRGFAQERNAQAALGAIQEKEAASCELTTADFCNVIGAFGAEGEWNMALELLRTMNETGPAPDANAYLTVFTTLKR